MEKQNVLIIEDEPLELSLFVQFCEGQSFEVVVAEDGEVGLEILRQEKIDLAIVDLYLPKMSGLDLLKQAKLEQIQTPIVIISGYSSLKSGGEAAMAGAVGALDKPFSRDRFLEMINTHLPKADLWRESLETFFEACYGNADLRCADIIRHFGFAKTSLYKLMKKHLGKPFRQYLLSVRLAHAEEKLRETSLQIIEIAIQCGFGTLDHFSRAFKKKFGCSPSAYRKKVNMKPNFGVFRDLQSGDIRGAQWIYGE